jgi:AbrB family looped-hinge helix DNA binding protein
MRATGIVRPLDQLGRVVLPKKLRKNLNINIDDPLEIFVEGETIIVTKYYPANQRKMLLPLKTDLCAENALLIYKINKK